MGYKDLGPNVSQDPQGISTGGQFSGEGRSYESVVIQSGSPVIDWEMNLRGDVSIDYGYRLNNTRISPSCFLGGDFMERSNVSGSFIFLPSVAGNENLFRMRAQDTIINGWNVRVEYSGTSTPEINDIVLTAPPISGNRVDLVIMEVWRGLITAIPDTANKSPGALILRNGNVKAPDSVNLTDDLIDPTFGSESNARVQIQYRLRVVPGVDISKYPDGISDPIVFANSVSDWNGPGADGTVTSHNFVPVSDDPGLWKAGTGDSVSATVMGSVDGYIYAVPVCAVARRNSAAWNKDSNQNGGFLISAGISDRPDGLFVDSVVSSDIIDLRRGYLREFQEINDKMISEILSNTMSTQFEKSLSGPSGTSFLAMSSIAASSSFGLSDGIRRHFSDRAITEVITVKSDIAAAVSSVDFDLSSLMLSWATSGVDVITSSPTGTTISGFGDIRVVQASLKKDENMLDASSSIYVSASELKVNVGPEVDRLHLDFNTATTVATTIYVSLYVSYHSGNGTSRNMISQDAFWVPGNLPTWVNTSLLTATTDSSRQSLGSLLWKADESHREVGVHFQSITQNKIVYTLATNVIMIPERIDGTIIINDGINATYGTTNHTANTAITTVSLSGATSIPIGTAVTVSYVAFRAIPEVGVSPNDRYDFFYETAAIQSISPPAGTSTLDLIPRFISKHISVISASTGSPSQPLPFKTPGEQIAIAALPAVSYPESKISGPLDVSVSGFISNGGFLQLPIYVPYVPDPSLVSLFRDATDVVIDASGRYFWPKSDSGVGIVYSPGLAGQDLKSARSHKIVFTMVAELKSDFQSIGRKGTLVLVVFSNIVVFDTVNHIALTPISGMSGASIFRTRGNILNSRRVDV